MLRDSMMDLARCLAERGRYSVAPNPLVGAVVSRDGEVVSEGWHSRAGGDHAEVAALDRAGGAAGRATLHVTLEPCNHYGRTPPCVDAILRAGISRVVVGQLDPDPRMRGRSVELLRGAGVEVEVLDAGPAFERQNEQYLHHMRTGRPFVHVKLATTLDGRIAAVGGDSRWVTGEDARLRAHELRAEAGAVLVGANTVRTDDPMLTPRDLPIRPPRITRVVLDPHLSTSPGSKLAKSAGEAPVVLFCVPSALDARERDLEDRGVEVVAAPRSEEGMDLHFVLEELGGRGIKGLLVEGGGATATGFVGRGLADKMTLFYAPKLLGAEGVPMIGALRASKMAESLQFTVSEVDKVGTDIAVTLYPGVAGEEERVHRAC